MTKSQLIDTIAASTPEIARSEIEAAVKALFDCIVAGLKRDERIEIRGFGSFVNRPRQAREGRNPRTGQLISVPARQNPFFTAGKDLRDRINAGGDSDMPVADGEAA